jgi:hypothetical protein
MSANNAVQIREFLYMDPDTSMMVCMIADGDGFRPAYAHEELQDDQLQQIYKQSSDAIQTTADVADELSGVDEFIRQYDHAYPRPSA